ADLAKPGARPQHRPTIMRNADAIRKGQILEDGSCYASLRIMAYEPAITASLESVERPVGELITSRGLAEIDPSIGRYIKIVREIKAGVVSQPRASPVRAIRHLEGRTVGANAVDAHARDARQ